MSGPGVQGGAGGTRLIAPAKLTVSLRVTGVRDDGFHLIRAEMVTLDLCDELTLIPSDSITVTATGPASPIGGLGPDDLVARALRAAARTAAVTVDKHIPAGAGLGGGSADAAAILRWAGVDDPAVAVGLGADVAFCLVGGRASVGGIGEVVDPIAHRDEVFTLVTPPVHCSTPAVYRRWDELGGPSDPAEDAVANDLTIAALDVAPELAAVRDELAADTGQVPRLAGSGSTWFVTGSFPGPGRVVTRTVPVGWTGTG